MADLNRERLIELIAVASHGEFKKPLNLYGIDFRGENLSNLDLSGSSFENANLSRSVFDDANLSNAIFKNTECKNIRFQRTNFSNANFSELNDFEGSVFNYCDLSNVELSLNPQTTDFHGCIFNGDRYPHSINSNDDEICKSFQAARFSNSNFKFLTKYDFSYAGFYKCTFGSNLYACLTKCYLENAWFTECIFSTEISECKIINSIFGKCEFKKPIINSTITDSKFTNSSNFDLEYFENCDFSGFLEFTYLRLKHPITFKNCNDNSTILKFENVSVTKEFIENSNLDSFFTDFSKKYKYEKRDCIDPNIYDIVKL